MASQGVKVVVDVAPRSVPPPPPDVVRVVLELDHIHADALYRALYGAQMEELSFVPFIQKVARQDILNALWQTPIAV